MYKKQQKDFIKCVEAKFEAMKSDQKDFVEETKCCIETFKSSALNSDRPWLTDLVPKKVQEQLNELHDKHQSEIKRLEKQIDMQKTWREEKNIYPNEQSMLNVYDFAEEEKKAAGKYT